METLIVKWMAMAITAMVIWYYMEKFVEWRKRKEYTEERDFRNKLLSELNDAVITVDGKRVKSSVDELREL